jgi:hypothetical protein
MSIGDYARINVQSIVQGVGTSKIEFYLADQEIQLTRDVYGGIQSTSVQPISLFCFPIRLSPSQKFLEKVGMTEILDALFYLPMKTLQENNLDIDSFDLIRSRILYKGVEYVIKEKNYYSQYGDEFLYLVLGGHKK